MKKKIICLFLLIYIFLISNTILAAPIGWRFCTYEQAKMAIKMTRNINRKDQNGKTPLIWAAGYNNNCKVTTLLINKGAKVHLKDNNGLTALIHAVKNENKPCVVKALLNAGANINYQSPNGNTALIWSVKNGNLELTKLLINSQANIDISNNQNKTAIDISKENNNSEIKKILKGNKNYSKNKPKPVNNPSKNIDNTPKQPKDKKIKIQSSKKEKQKNKENQKPLKKRSVFYDGVNYNSYNLENDNLNFKSSARGIGGFIGYKYYLKRNIALGVELEHLKNICDNNNSPVSINNLFLMFKYHFFFIGTGANYPSNISDKNTGLSLKTGLKLEKEINNRLHISTSLIYRQMKNEIKSTEINLSSYGLQGGFNIKF